MLKRFSIILGLVALVASLSWSAPAKDNSFWVILAHMTQSSPGQYDNIVYFDSRSDWSVTVDSSEASFVMVAYVYGQMLGNITGFYGDTKAELVRTVNTYENNIVTGAYFYFMVRSQTSGVFALQDNYVTKANILVRRN